MSATANDSSRGASAASAGKATAATGGSSSRSATSTQSCVHCGATETPLWRAGPAGPKTLCNACGVRWKKTGSVIPRLSRSRRALTKPNSRRKDKSSTMTNTSTSTTATTAATTATTTTTAAPKSKQKVPDLPALQLPQNPAPYEHVRAPRPHTAAESRRTYESIFSGLMVVPRASRARTRTARAQMFFESVAAAGGGGSGGAGAAGAAEGSPTASAGNQTPTTPAKGSSTGHRRKRDGVYVTEVVAPSPSPSPPPIPRMLPVPEGLGFRIVLAKPSSKYSAFDPSSPTTANNVNDDDVRRMLNSPRPPKLDANSNDVPASSAAVPSPQPRIRDVTPPRTHQLPISDESVKHEEKRAKTSPKNADVPHAAAVATEDNNASIPPAVASPSASAATKLKDAQEDPKNAHSA